MSARPSRYHLAEQHDGHGWLLVRLKDLGAGWPAEATVVECNLPEAAARLRLLEMRAAEVLEPDYPIELVDEELSESGGDPEAIGKRGAALVETLLAKRRERAS